ncbi:MULTISPECIES: hypothetical protein [unclassified Mesorhizobium]|uniref:hypothetical protein n=1 Tax=Mesorhizobium TaxID=68287 RepID=UPI0003CF7601|nr:MULTISPECIES: hypothetical protein [unclassified Mesorhizobium]ESY96257.1 hypothetical protein X741_05340 [Mesorhizobium sp. LNHC229A00]ESY99520.1 hypothetical protein X738_09670 [Mesorhizobium sp. LNHC209A00]
MPNQETERQYTERLLNEMIAEANAAEQARAEEARVARANAAGAMAARTALVLARAVKPALPRSEPFPARTAKPRMNSLPREAADLAQASRESLIDGLFAAGEWPQPPKPQFPRLGKKKADRRSDIVIAALGIALGLTCALFPWYIFFNQDQFGVQAIKFGGTGTNSGRAGGGVVAERSAPLTDRDVPNADVDLLATGTVQDDSKTQPPGEQPFPADIGKFRMVHVANGRAMIEDDTGLWMVQRGSTLPDSSKVSAIEQRNGKWVMLTSANHVIELSR